jgi:hypothetical protein
MNRGVHNNSLYEGDNYEGLEDINNKNAGFSSQRVGSFIQNDIIYD